MIKLVTLSYLVFFETTAAGRMAWYRTGSFSKFESGNVPVVATDYFSDT
jgi:hypothetical protein